MTVADETLGDEGLSSTITKIYTIAGSSTATVFNNGGENTKTGRRRDGDSMTLGVVDPGVAEKDVVTGDFNGILISGVGCFKVKAREFDVVGIDGDSGRSSGRGDDLNTVSWPANFEVVFGDFESFVDNGGSGRICRATENDIVVAGCSQRVGFGEGFDGVCWSDAGVGVDASVRIPVIDTTKSRMGVSKGLNKIHKVGVGLRSDDGSGR